MPNNIDRFKFKQGLLNEKNMSLDVPLLFHSFYMTIINKCYLKYCGNRYC